VGPSAVEAPQPFDRGADVGISREFRQVSERAIAVHKPREACRAAGFQPRF
jgi:hypothetical protein